MQAVMRFLISLEDKQRVEEEAKKLGLESSDFLRLLVRLYFNGIRLERRQLVNKGGE